jgi:hypothetical protein
MLTHWRRRSVEENVKTCLVEMAYVSMIWNYLSQYRTQWRNLALSVNKMSHHYVYFRIKMTTLLRTNIKLFPFLCIEAYAKVLVSVTSIFYVTEGYSQKYSSFLLTTTVSEVQQEGRDSLYFRLFVTFPESGLDDEFIFLLTEGGQINHFIKLH